MLPKSIAALVGCTGLGTGVAWVGVSLSDAAGAYEREECGDSPTLCLTGAEPAAAVGWFLLAVFAFALLIGVIVRERRQGCTAGLLVGSASVLVPLWLEERLGDGVGPASGVGTSAIFWAGSAMVPGALGYLLTRRASR
ncbi:hypothetical protein ACXZ65_32270 [Streptomyces aculeolatus]